LRIPAVFLNVRQEFDCVHPDEVMGGRLATECLLCLGHERIAYADTPVTVEPHFSRADRRTGYEQAMATAGRRPHVHQIPQDWRLPEQLNIDAPPIGDARVEAARRLLSGPGRPTAIVAYEMAEAMAVVHAAHQSGLRVPEDLSIVVFHHRIDDSFFRPFHTVCNAMAEVGAESVSMLLEKIESPETPYPARSVAMRLLDGASCLPPRGPL